MSDIDFKAGRLPGRAVLAVRGPDAAGFLHNLVTADVEHLPPGGAAYAALLSPQGKMLFDFFAVRQADGFLIDCAASQRAELTKRLGFYRLRSKVEVAAVDGLGVSVSHDGGNYADPRTPLIGWRSFTPAEEDAAAEGYDAARIALGLADTDADLGSGQFFPHEANLDQLGGVSFRKGCYIGQEVVSRMEHRGTARSRILPVRIEGDAPAKDSEIRSGEKLVGSLLSSSGDRALALVRLDRLAEATEPLLTAGVRAHVLKPRWARYEVPGAEEAA